jgi:hypothetical protein
VAGVLPAVLVPDVVRPDDVTGAVQAASAGEEPPVVEEGGPPRRADREDVDLAPGVLHAAFGEVQVVAHEQPHPTERRFDDDGLVGRRESIGLVAPEVPFPVDRLDAVGR